MKRRGEGLLAGSLAAALALSACGGGGGGSVVTPPDSAPPAIPPAVPADSNRLTTADVETILRQAVGEARAQSLPAILAVTDRVGNVLAVYKLDGARDTAIIRAGNDGDIGLQGVEIPAAAAAIAKAITGAYLSSTGNAFSTRTASMIVQQHFPMTPYTAGLESGPLFGAQLSSLPCSDIMARFSAAGGAAGQIGPKRSPLGLSADPGGLPLYKNGVLVGGIGVMADGDYGFDDDVSDVDADVEELVAVAGASGFAAPDGIRADRISIDGTMLRYSDASVSDLRSTPASAPSLASQPGALLAVAGYFDGASIRPGVAYGTEASGIRAATAAEFGDSSAFVLSDGSGSGRFPIQGGSDAAEVGAPISAAEARAILTEAFAVMSRSRGQIRKPLDSRAQMSISLVDTRGTVLGLVRAADAPVFGIDISVQKARTAAFFSNRMAADDLRLATEADVRAVVQRMTDLLDRADALTGGIAFTTRAIGNLARPHFPDGEVARGHGPLSVPINRFSPFATGLQTSLIAGNLVTHLGHVASGGASADVAPMCTTLPVAGSQNRMANGAQIFPGSVPVYRGNMLVGAIGVSGDGIDQDDMAAFLGMHQAAARTSGITNAASGVRSDQVQVTISGGSVRLRYVACPFAPFLDTADQSPCVGK